MRVSAVVRFDNLTRRYQITFIEDGRVEEVRTTDDEAHRPAVADRRSAAGACRPIAWSRTASTTSA